MMKKVDFNDYVCGVPFAALEIHEKDRFLCCASWLKKHLPQHTSPKDAWESSEANEIRESVIDGSFRHCDKSQCPYLHQLENFGEIGNTSVLYHKNRLPKELKSNIESFKKGIVTPPSTIQFSFDRTCNLKCPSCRINLMRLNHNMDKPQKDYTLLERGTLFFLLGLEIFSETLIRTNGQVYPIYIFIPMLQNGTEKCGNQ